MDTVDTLGNAAELRYGGSMGPNPPMHAGEVRSLRKSLDLCARGRWCTFRSTIAARGCALPGEESPARDWQSREAPCRGSRMVTPR